MEAAPESKITLEHLQKSLWNIESPRPVWNIESPRPECGPVCRHKSFNPSQRVPVPLESGSKCLNVGFLAEERIFIELMTSDRKLKASREGSK